MKLNINNIVATLLALVGGVIFLRHKHEALAFLSAADRIGPGNSPQDITSGLIVIGLCGAVLVAIVRVLTSNRRD